MKLILKVKCPECNGDKTIKAGGGLRIKCPTCKGEADISACSDDGEMSGNFSNCPNCLGTGKLWDEVAVCAVVDDLAAKQICTEKEDIVKENIVIEPKRRGRPKSKAIDEVR